MFGSFELIHYIFLNISPFSFQSLPTAFNFLLFPLPFLSVRHPGHRVLLTDWARLLAVSNVSPFAWTQSSGGSVTFRKQGSPWRYSPSITFLIWLSSLRPDWTPPSLQLTTCSLASGLCSPWSVCWPHSAPPSHSSRLMPAHPPGFSPLSWEDFLHSKCPDCVGISPLPTLPLVTAAAFERSPPPRLEAMSIRLLLSPGPGLHHVLN